MPFSRCRKPLLQSWIAGTVRRTAHPLSMDRRHAPQLARPGPLPRAHRGVGSADDGSGTGFEEVVVKTKNLYYDMRAVRAQLHFNVVKHEPPPTDTNESEVYFTKLLPAEVARGHRLKRTVVQAG
jgi:hypothetical protein